MKNISIRNLIEVTQGRLIGKVDEGYRAELLNTEINGIAIDSREVKEDTLFVAIKGDRTDAHRFIPEVAKVTKAILTEENEDLIIAKADVSGLPANIAYIKVDSTIDALQKIGAYVRSRYEKTVIGVTGSVGKTTTREMITAALSANIKTFHTEGNMNSQIGVPLTASRLMDEDSEAAVLEMGISEPGGMDKLTEIVKPDIGVVTMIGQAHIEFLKTKEGIRNEKLNIAGRMDSTGALFLNIDDPMLRAVKGKLNVKTFFYGTSEDADYRAENIRFENGYNAYTYVHDGKRLDVYLNVLGVHNVLNSLVAMAISDYLGLDIMKAAKCFEDFEGMRQKIIHSDNDYIIIDDSYNASPDSMKAAFNVIRDMSVGGRKIAVLGDMFELGPNSPEFHAEVGQYIAGEYSKDRSSIDELITIGKDSRRISEYVEEHTDIKTKHFEEKSDAIDYIKSILKPGDVITLKASNGMKFAEIVDSLK